MSSDNNQPGAIEADGLKQQASGVGPGEAPQSVETTPTASDLAKRIRSWEAYLNSAGIPIVKSFDLDQSDREICIHSEELIALITRFTFDEFGVIFNRADLRAFQTLLHGMALQDRRTTHSTEQLLGDSTLLEALNILMRMQEWQNGLDLPAEKLLCELQKIASQHSLEMSGKDWPKSSNRLQNCSMFTMRTFVISA